MMYRTVTVTPRITKSVIRAEVGIINPVVSVQAEYYVPVRSYDTIEYYDGSYEVNPDFNGTTLQTAGKAMRNNVNVNPIQVENVSNPQGGRTVYNSGGTDDGSSIPLNAYNAGWGALVADTELPVVDHAIKIERLVTS